MDPKELLFGFEEKYPFLYDIAVNSVPIYTCYRDGVLACLQQSGQVQSSACEEEKGRVFPRRILEGAVKLLRLRKSRTLIFTSSMYRRDKGRNLAAEFLMDKYPDAVVFEWPSRTEAYDAAYFSDAKKDRYCPLDFYIICYRLYIKVFRNKYNKLTEECRRQLEEAFEQVTETSSESEKAAISYLLESLPDSYAATACSHAVFRRLFAGYKGVEYAVDFWGSARENIIPVLPGAPESIELQHGIITGYHPGYIYPEFVKARKSRFFGRTLLVYGEKTKQLLTEKSIFGENQIEVIGNPRIKAYKKLYPMQETERKLILFTSQPYEQDGVGTGFYKNAITYLQEIQKLLQIDNAWHGYRLGIKLHPRENDSVKALYEKALPDVQIYGNASQLYELLHKSWLQVTVSSTSLYEAAEFGTATVCICYGKTDHVQIYGFQPIIAEESGCIERVLCELRDAARYGEYVDFLKEQTKQYI